MKEHEQSLKKLIDPNMERQFHSRNQDDGGSHKGISIVASIYVLLSEGGSISARMNSKG